MHWIKLAYWISLAGAFWVSWGSIHFWRRWCLRHGWVDEPGGRKDHGEAIPLAGGLGVFTGLSLVTAAGVLAVLSGWLPGGVQDALAHGLERRGLPLVSILLGACAITGLGLWDDRHELGAGVKLAVQVGVALLVAGSGIRITLFVPSLFFSFAITALWIVGLMNAVNFMDNMNGLCAGLGAIAAGWFSAAALVHGQYLVAIFALAVAGALLGFLPHNFPRARVFLGDSGSQLTGYLLGVMAILPHFYSLKHPVRWAVLTPLLVLAVPLVDLVQVVCTRLRLGRPVWVGDHNHLSHRLVRAGLSRTGAVLVLWLVALACGAVTSVWW